MHLERLRCGHKTGLVGWVVAGCKDSTDSLIQAHTNDDAVFESGTTHVVGPVGGATCEELTAPHSPQKG